MQRTRSQLTRSLLVALMIGSCLTVCATGCSERRSEQHRLEGDAYFQLAKYPEAIAAYRKAESANPNNATARVGLGRCLMVQQQYDEALAEFRKAIELDPSLEAAYAEGTNVLLRTDRVGEALAVAQQLEAVQPEHGGMLHAFVLLRQGRAADAVTLLAALRDQSPKSVDVRVNLATALLAVQQPDKAEAEAKAVLEGLDPNSVAARMVLVDAYRLQGKVDAVVAELQKLVEDNPHDLGMKLGLARGLVYAGRAEEARTIANGVLEQDPGSGWANYVLGACLVEKGQYAEAVNYLQAAENALPRQADVARLLAVARSGSESKPTVGGAAPEGAAPGAAESAREDWKSLWQQAALPRLLRGREGYLATGEPNVRETLVLAGVFTFNSALANELAQALPESSAVRTFVDLLKQGKLEDLIQHVDQWKEGDSQRQLLRENALGFALARGGARARGVQVFSKCLQTWPDNAVALYNIAQVFRNADLPEFAARTLQKLIAQYPKNSDSHTLLYIVLRDAGMTTEARKAAEAAYSVFPTSRDTIISVAEAFFDTKDLELSKKVLARGLETFPNDAALKLQLTTLTLQSGDLAAAQKMLDAVPVSGDLAARVVLTKALCAALQGDWQKVVALSEGLDLAAAGPIMRFLLAAAHLKANENEAAIKVLSSPDTSKPVVGRVGEVLLQALGRPSSLLSEDEVALAAVVAKDPAALSDFAFASACQAAQLHDAALDVLRKLEPALGTNPRFSPLYFLSLSKAFGVAKPADEGRAFAQRHETSPAAWLGLAAMFRSLRDMEGERQALDKAVELAPESLDAWIQRAQFFEREQDLKALAEASRRVLAARPEDPVANNNLAYSLLMTGGDAQEALKCAQKAKGKLPTHASVLHTLGVAQLRTGDLEESKKNLGAALELRPGDPTLLLDFGQLLIAQKQEDEGRKHIRLAIQYADQLGLDFPRRAEAEKILKAPGAAT